MKMPNITECRECGSTALTWDTHNKNISQAQQGRLTTQDIRCQFVLGCDHCSETLAVVSADQIAAWLTESREASAEPSAPEVTLVSYAEDMSTCTLTKGDGVGYFYDRVDAEPSAPIERDELVSEDELRDMASIACQSALAHGVSEDWFMQLARSVEHRARAALDRKP